MPKVRTIDKQREAIRRQLYGKEVFTSKSTVSPTGTYQFKADNGPASSNPYASSDISYLKKDLLKILVLTTTAIVLQIILFIASQNGLIHFS